MVDVSTLVVAVMKMYRVIELEQNNHNTLKHYSSRYI